MISITSSSSQRHAPDFITRRGFPAKILQTPYLLIKV